MRYQPLRISSKSNMKELNFQNRLQLYGSSLSKSEMRVAEFIASNTIDAAIISSNDLAQNVGTSNSTISRFCQKLQYRNYIELQTLLKAENNTQTNSFDVVDRLNHYYDVVFSSTAELLDKNTFSKFIEQLQNADQILVCGIGSSGLTAIELSSRLMRMGLSSQAITDSSLMLMKANRFSPRDLLIAISTSGETQEVLKTCAIANNIKTPICALTKNNNTQLTALSDITLFVSDENQIHDNLFVNTQLSFLFMIDIITYTLLMNPTYNASYQKAQHI
ncbi:MurR/RpiR family transcriptional regulator [Anoxybacterium hadale]|uniref:MurR/RpiR family transcriptional regulator n=1 Tax=Anoxybacterium hadale TaxID=3408580 RepID=A0ACD1AFD4_9FIRM|nr:MurR/RpiR family transcriptional regulator [Clostridiales bacterium]